MTVALCMFALWAWGGWISWKGIENGNGWIGVIPVSYTHLTLPTKA